MDFKTALPEDKIVDTLQKPYDQIGDKINKIESYIRNEDDLYKEAAKFYCENPADSSEKFGEKVLVCFYIYLYRF